MNFYCPVCFSSLEPLSQFTARSTCSAVGDDLVPFLQTFYVLIWTPCKQGVFKVVWERRDDFILFFKYEGLCISVIQDLEEKHEIMN